jgi:hypothetical protein
MDAGARKTTGDFQDTKEPTENNRRFPRHERTHVKFEPPLALRLKAQLEHVPRCKHLFGEACDIADDAP